MFRKVDELLLEIVPLLRAPLSQTCDVPRSRYWARRVATSALHVASTPRPALPDTRENGCGRARRFSSSSAGPRAPFWRKRTWVEQPTSILAKQVRNGRVVEATTAAMEQHVLPQTRQGPAPKIAIPQDVPSHKSHKTFQCRYPAQSSKGKHPTRRFRANAPQYVLRQMSHIEFQGQVPHKTLQGKAPTRRFNATTPRRSKAHIQNDFPGTRIRRGVLGQVYNQTL
jgi:hypothetical protein